MVTEAFPEAPGVPFGTEKLVIVRLGRGAGPTVNVWVVQLFDSFDSVITEELSAQTSKRCVPTWAVQALVQFSTSVAPGARALVVWFAGVTSKLPSLLMSNRSLVWEETAAAPLPEFLTVAANVTSWPASRPPGAVARPSVT